jgi:hypothetical protein
MFMANAPAFSRRGSLPSFAVTPPVKREASVARDKKGWCLRPLALNSSQLRHCEERSDEAIQNLNAALDCFASLAMTKESKGSGTPTDANPTCRVADTAARSASAHAYRRPTAALARGRSPPQGSAPGHVSWDPAERDPVGDPLAGQDRRCFSGCYPPLP